MFLTCMSEYEDVVEVDAHRSLTDQVPENIIHHSLKRSGLPFIPFPNPHVVIPPSHVQLREVLGSL
ncbi:hypothetical protein AX17_006889 [Amanita inopinata Kibby_2008]|nr:hypothetical protein AX17_006889 [Amanita inopinata Kibby_2008]